MPFVSASAMGPNDPSTPPAQKGTNERLEQVWARQLRAYDRLGKGFDHADDFIARTQNLIDRASANGRDVTALQGALDAFEASIKKALPVYESAGSIVNSHPGFDDKGHVGDQGIPRVQSAPETDDHPRSLMIPALNLSRRNAETRRHQISVSLSGWSLLPIRSTIASSTKPPTL
jgi:hypothetical protein